MKQNDVDYALGSNATKPEDFIVFKDEFLGGIHKTIRGNVRTKHGIAIVHSCYYEGRYKSSGVEMVKNGRSYYRRFDDAYGERGLTDRAKEFAEELFNV